MYFSLSLMKKLTIFPLRLFPTLHWVINFANETALGVFYLLFFDKAYFELKNLDEEQYWKVIKYI